MASYSGETFNQARKGLCSSYARSIHAKNFFLDELQSAVKYAHDRNARIYVTFEYEPTKLSFFEKVKYETVKLLYGQYPPLAAINYIWESKAPKGTAIPNPYTANCPPSITHRLTRDERRVV
jgi:hypothetical protein